MCYVFHSSPQYYRFIILKSLSVTSYSSQMKLIKFINNKKPLAILTLFNIFIYILVQNHVNSAVKELVRIEREAYQSKCYFPEPSLIYEQKRRRIRSTIENLWSSVRYRIQIKKRFPNFYNDLLRVLKEVYEHKL